MSQLTSTERSRRRRAHLKDDHTLCGEACNGVAEPIRPTPPPQLTRGEQLAADLEAERKLTPAESALVEEMGRVVDRLDRLDTYLADRQWLQFEVAPYSTEKTVTVVVKLDRVMAETRQQEDCFRAMVAELRQSSAWLKKAQEPPAPSPDTSGGPGLGGIVTRLAEFKARGPSAG